MVDTIQKKLKRKYQKQEKVVCLQMQKKLNIMELFMSRQAFVQEN